MLEIELLLLHRIRMSGKNLIHEKSQFSSINGNFVVLMFRYRRSMQTAAAADEVIEPVIVTVHSNSRQ